MMSSGPGYREASARCPACAIPMEPRALFDCTVDVCADCKGLWVDWYDGDLVKVAADAAPLSARACQGAEAGLVGAGCPRCQHPLKLESFHGEGPALFRCGDCGGAFVPRSSFEALVANADVPREPPPAAPGALARLLAVVRRLLHTEPMKP